MGRKDVEKEADYNFKWCETDWAPQEVHPGAPRDFPTGLWAPPNALSAKLTILLTLLLAPCAGTQVCLWR